MDRKVKYIKHNTMNLLDFIVTNYGTVDSLFTFLQSANISNYSDFLSKDNKTFELYEIPTNSVTDTYAKSRYTVSSYIYDSSFSSLRCNDDLTFKTIVKGDYNDDFNNDFSTTDIETVVVGYEGMTLICTFSITNIGNKNGIAEGTLKLTNAITKDYSVEILAGETKVITIEFENVLSGIYDVTLLGTCVQTKTIEVLGNPIFTCVNDFAITEQTTYTQNDTVTLTWTVSNTGTANGLYSGNWKVIKNGSTEQKDISVIINSGSDYEFSFDYVLNEVGFYNFISSCGQIININVVQYIPLVDIVYNNDLQLVNNQPIYDGDVVTVKWSMTNNGSESGTTQGFIEYYPADSSNISNWATNPTVIQSGQTVWFYKEFTVNAGERNFRLTGDAYDILTIQVVSQSNVYKYVFWVDNDAIAPYEPIYNQSDSLIINYGNVLCFHAVLVNQDSVDHIVNVRLNMDNSFNFANYDINVPANSSITTMNDIGMNILIPHTIRFYLDNVLKGTKNIST